MSPDAWMTFDTDTLKKQIPYYLTAADRESLVRELESISKGGNAEYILSTRQDAFGSKMLQGDGWRGLELFSFDTGTRRSVKGLVLSNSCDVDTNNPRDLPTRIVFAPLVKLQTYVSLLQKSGIEYERIDSKIAAIKAQKTTNVFYLPAGSYLDADYVIRLDDAHSIPMAVNHGSAVREKLYTLSNTGFYMLIFKLSLHFCRLQENVNRKAGEFIPT